MRRSNPPKKKQTRQNLLFLGAAVVVAAAVITAIAFAGSSKAAEPADNSYVKIKFESSEEPKQNSDPLLVLVNNEVAIPEDYSPHLVDFAESCQVSDTIYDPLTELLRDARDSGMNLWIASSYRSAEEQEAILASAAQNREAEYGMTESEAMADALESIALPGHSEHETGLAVDFNTVSEDFENTSEFVWLSENAENYGFVLRYPKEKENVTGIIYEAWHYRYVGVENAKAMNSLGMCLEEYVEYLGKQQ